MKILRSLITILVGSGRAEARAGERSPVKTGHEPTRFDAMWDEVLMNSMHCEAARSFLDHLGPRAK